MDSRREQFFRQFQRDRTRLIAYIRAITGNWDLAEDIFQEVSLVLLDKVDKLELEGDFHAWCRSVARNIACRERSKSKRLKAIRDDTVLDLIDNAFADSEREQQQDFRREQLRVCMQKLSPQNLQLVSMRYLSELSLKDLAAKLNRSEGAVQVALSRVRKAILECVQRNQESAI
jgi:RNA polymerase sigma-70 factor, ECF subfamily